MTIVAAAAIAVVAIVVVLRVAAGAQRRSRPGYFSPQYAARVSADNGSWQALRFVTFALTLGRDVLLPVLPARTLDHLTYARLGHEWPLRDVVPLSRTTHAIVTAARDVVGRGPVNAILRVALLAWLVLDYEVAALIANLAGVKIPPIVSLPAIAAFLAPYGAAVERGLLGCLRALGMT